MLQALLEKRRHDVDVQTDRNQPFYNMVCVQLSCVFFYVYW